MVCYNSAPSPLPPIPSTSNTNLTPQPKDSGAEILVALDMFYATIARALPKTSIKKLILCGIKDYLPFPLNLLYPIKAKIEKQWVSVERVPPIYDFMSLLNEAPATPVLDRCISRRDSHFTVYRRNDRYAQGCDPHAPKPRCKYSA